MPRFQDRSVFMHLNFFWNGGSTCNSLFEFLDSDIAQTLSQCRKEKNVMLHQNLIEINYLYFHADIEKSPTQKMSTQKTSTQKNEVKTTLQLNPAVLTLVRPKICVFFRLKI